MSEIFDTAKAIVRVHVTYEQACRRDNKPLCYYCLIPCDPRSREYRALRICSLCYRDLGPMETKPKHLLPKKEPR
jgi:hypothetical protein